MNVNEFVKAIDAMPAGRGMDGLIHKHVLGRSLENYCALSLHPDDGQCEGCDLPCLLPRYSTDWGAVREVMDMPPDFGLTRLIGNKWLGQSAFCGGCRLCGKAHTPELAVGRAALKWAVNKVKVIGEGQ